MIGRNAFALALITVLIGTGCTSKTGIIKMQSSPPGASVFLNDVNMGTAPVSFEYDIAKPGTLRVEREGYYPEVEVLDMRWLKRQRALGNLIRGRFMVEGKETKSWKVDKVADLKPLD